METETLAAIVTIIWKIDWMKFPSSAGSRLSTMNMSVVKRFRILPDGFVSTHFNGARRIACVILSNKTFDVRKPMAVIVTDLATCVTLLVLFKMDRCKGSFGQVRSS